MTIRSSVLSLAPTTQARQVEEPELFVWRDEGAALRVLLKRCRHLVPGESIICSDGCVFACMKECA
jgi:hypothetical protein